MTEYYFEDFESYSEIFRQHAVYMAEMMKALDDEIIGNGLPPVGRAKELFRMTMDLTYHADQSYKKKFNIESRDCPTFGVVWLFDNFEHGKDFFGHFYFHSFEATLGVNYIMK